MSARGLWFVMLLAFLLVVASVPVPFAAGAGELVVDTLGDAGDGSCDPGSCTLRDALIEANGNPDANTITFAFDGTIILEDTLTVGNDLTIDATGRDVTVSGDDLHRVIHLVAGDTIPILEIRSLAIIEGAAQSGAGIFNNGGELIILDSLFSGNVSTSFGGGVYTLGGAVTIERSTFADNVASVGGAGLLNDNGILTIVDSTFAKNASPVGAGLYQNVGTSVVTNSTFSGNIALGGGGGLLLFGGSMTVVNSTITLNSAGDAAGVSKFDSPDSTLILTNTIVAENVGGENCGGAIVNGGNNIEDGTSCGWGSQNGSLSDTNPQLGPLADNGGPTQTHALLPGSPAIDGMTFNAPNDCPAADQRGVPRPQGAACDIGAFESALQSGPELIVNSLDDDNDGACETLIPGLADCTLREAIVFANGNPDANTITFAVDGTIVLQDSLTVGNDLVIDGTGRDITVSGDGAHRVLTLLAGDNTPVLELKALTIADGEAIAGGGVSNAGGELIVTGSTFRNNSATGQGGAIFNDAGALTVEASTLTANTAGTGGTVYSRGGTVSVTNSTVSGNQASVGGGLYQFSGVTTVVNSTITGNAATIQGGGLFNFDGTMTVRNSIIAMNPGDNCVLVITNGGNNIDSGETCGWGSADGSMSNADPLLSPLADNGGPTQTHALLPGSPAIDGVVFNAPNDCPAADQRGEARPQGVACDIGAFEADPLPPHEAFILNLPVVLANGGQ